MATIDIYIYIYLVTLETRWPFCICLLCGALGLDCLELAVLLHQRRIIANVINPPLL